MLVLNDQLRHHLNNWDDEPSEDEIVLLNKSTSDKNVELKDDEEKDEVGTTDSQRIIKFFKDRIIAMNHQDTCVKESFMFFVIQFYSIVQGRCSIYSPQMLVFLLIFLKMILDHHRLFWSLITSSKEGSTIIKHQRIILSGLLARNGAPPINHFGEAKLISEQQNVARVYREFLCVVDDALERLQSATSINLGLGIWSPAVHRVSSAEKRFIASRSKRILAYGLLHSLNFSKKSGEEVEPVPSVFTISWLQFIRREKLPLALTASLEKLSTLEELQKYRQFIEENTAYLKACFFDMKQVSKNESSSIQLVAQQLHAAEIALWAYCDEDTSEECRRRQWLEQFGSLLKTAQIINDDVFKDTEKKTSGNEEDEIHNSNLVAKQQSPASFEDPGVSQSSSKLVASNAMDRNETYVYSGKGSLPHEFYESLGPVPIPQTNNFRTKVSLFQELQSRLDKLDKVSEISICPDDDETEKCDQAARRRNKKEKCQVIKLSGNLLSELKVSIGAITHGESIG